jgi:hypothetical protein
MQKRTGAEIGIVAALLAGCTGLPWGTATPPPEEPASSAVWIRNPRAYAEDVASSGEQERERLRRQALEDFLEAPSAEQQVRMSLVYEAATQSVADGYAAADTLAHALEGSTYLPPDARALLTSLLLRTEKRIDDLRAIASRERELEALRDAYRALEQGKSASEAQRASVLRALRDAEAKLEALKSIEQTLEGGVPPPVQLEASGDTTE